MKFEPLVTTNEENFWSGTVFQLPGLPAYEDLVELMIADSPSSTFGIVLIITTGHKAGAVLLDPPIEAKSDSGIALSKKWLLKNWDKWIMPGCDIGKVRVKKHYTPSE